MTTMLLKSPLAGWVLPLDEVPDTVFAQGMAGDGVAIDATGNMLHAPCDGEIVPMQAAKHAITVRTPSGHDIMMHVGIDTVQLAGTGFETLVQPGAKVKSGQALLRFDLDLIARRAKSAVTPILLTSEGVILRRCESRLVCVGDFLLELAAVAGTSPVHSAATGPVHHLSRFFAVPFDHGLHARPAAQVAAALRPFGATVTLVSRGRTGNAKSTVATMSLGIHCGEVIEARAVGSDAAAALAALAGLLAPASGPTHTPSAASAAAKLRETSDTPVRIDAVVASRGAAVGIAVQLAEPEMAVVEQGVGLAHENAALHAAVGAARARLQRLADTAMGEQQAILAAHVELIQDPELADRAEAWLARGKSAGYAWRESVRSTIYALKELGDARMLERVADFRDLENQVLRALAGNDPDAVRTLPDRAILLADEILPSQLVALDKRRIAGICTARGGPTSHVAIIAAALGIPALVAAGSRVLAVDDGTALILDADHGVLYLAPTEAERAAMEHKLATRAARHVADVAAAQPDSESADRVRIKVYANLGGLAEAAYAMANGAEGCGLLRSEFLFLERHAPPDEDEQWREYQGIATALGKRPLTIRTLDIGGDKPIPYLPLPREDNPALGLRGLRTSLWQPALLRTQLRAILRVKPLDQCRILLPMVTDLDDIRTVQRIIDELRRELGIEKGPSLGAMIETPASALLADQLLREVDFLSIGTNDLSQYTLAMDRGHPELAGRLDALHPAVLRLIATAAEAANRHGKEIAVCGGLGSDTAAIPILIGLGVHEVSAVPATIPRIKRVIRSLDSTACRDLAQQALVCANANMVRALVERWTSAPTPASPGVTP